MKLLRGTFGTRFGFYMAAVGSAIGLGTLWRFPYVTGNNGGGAFVLLYVFFVTAIGLPVLISELMLGRMTRRNIIGVMSWRSWVGAKRRWRWWGYLSLILSFVVLSYYTVVSGWVIHFTVQSLKGGFVASSPQSEKIIDDLMSRGYLQWLLASVHMVITVGIVIRGVQGGVEKTSRIFMPILFLLMLFLCIHSLFLPGAGEAMRFLFYPNFSKLSPTAVIEALGHALFTLSLGFGAMIAFGSYLKKEVPLPAEAAFVMALDTIASLLGGILIFPVVFSSGVVFDSGPSLLFKTMPILFGSMKGGYILGFLFFVSLYFAALSATLVLFEGLVAFFIDQLKFSRKHAAFVVAGGVLGLAMVSAFSHSLLKAIKFGERGIIELLDQVIINWSIPIVTLGVVLFIAKKVPEDEKRAQFVDAQDYVSQRMYITWQNSIQYVVPFLIVSIFLVQIGIKILSVIRN